MFSRAAVAVSACTDLVVERAIDLVGDVLVKAQAASRCEYRHTLSCSVPKMDAR